MKFLLIDDDDESIQIITKFLEKDFDAEVVHTSSGEEGLLQIVSTIPPVDLILLDIMMPDMNGIETCLRIREQTEYKNIPIIFVSASLEKDHLINSFYAGGTDFVRKPINRNELKNRIRLALKNKTDREQLLFTIKQQNELIERLNRSLDELSGKVPYDSNTNLFSRSRMEELIQQEWLRHKRSELGLILMLIRIEGLNPELKRAIASTLESTCRRAADHIGIWNDNTFVALITDAKSNNFQSPAELLQKALFEFSPIQTYIGVSSCVPPLNAGQSKDLIEGAQSALLEAKKKGPGSTEHKEVIFSKIMPSAS